MKSERKLLNDWEKQEIYHKNDILNFELLSSKDLVTSLEDDYYYLSTELDKVEYEVYKYYNEKLIEEMNLEDCEKELKNFIKQLHVYNELKDIGEALVNKIAERRGVTSKEVLKELNDE